MRIQNTKQLRSVFNLYQSVRNATITGYWKYGRTLDDVYNNYSSAKKRAYWYCEDLMKAHDGDGLIILGHNCMTFSVGFIGYINGLKHFFYITRDYDRALPLEKIDRETGEVTSTLTSL